MSTAAPAGPSKSVAVTILGLGTLLMGGAYATLGGGLIIAGADWLVHPGKEPLVQVLAFGGIAPAFLIVLGVAFLSPGILGLLAGLGILLRKQWGRILTFVVAAAAILLGPVWVGGSDWEGADIVVGASQILYGISAIVILIKKGAEFSRPRV